jgi:hypothetical protein
MCLEGLVHRIWGQIEVARPSHGTTVDMDLLEHIGI